MVIYPWNLLYIYWQVRRMVLYIYELLSIYEKECGNIMCEYMSDLQRSIELKYWYITKNIVYF